jgi:hypothetical protein
MLLPIAALALEMDLAELRDPLRQWFFTRSFALSFEVAANTALVAEYSALRSVLVEDRPVETPEASAATLLAATRQRPSAAWRAFLSALAFNNAQDLTGADLGLMHARETLQPLSDEVVVTSLYPPKGVLHEEKVDRRVLSTVLASRDVADRLRYGEPLHAQIRSVWSGDPQAHEGALASQFLPSMNRLEDLHASPRELFVARLEMLGAFLEREFAQRLRWDLEA